MDRFKTVLALDTALYGCCAGLYNGRRFSRSKPMASGQAEHIIPLIDDVLAEAGIKYSDLDAILTTVGPGAFTGLRIGMAAAKSMGLALNIPVFGVTTLQVLATQFAAKHPSADIGVILETKREDYYFQSFTSAGKAKSEPQIMSAGEIRAQGRLILIGDGLARFGEDLPCDPGYALSDAGTMAENFARAPESPVYLRNISPLYLKDADVSQSKRQNRVLAAN